MDIMVIALCAVICGAQDFTAIATFGRGKEHWLRRFLTLPGGIPSHDTFRRVFARLDTTAFSQCFTDWVTAIAHKTDNEIISLDGKRLRRSFDAASGQAAITLVSAWSWHNRLVLGQVKTDADSNETTAIPQLLRMLDVSGCIVTIDAAGTLKSIANQIVSQKANYVLALKRNQPELHADVQGCLDNWISRGWQDELNEPVKHSYYETRNNDHGRLETRRYWSMPLPDWIDKKQKWPGLTSITVVEAERTVSGTTSKHRRYYISSLDQDAKKIGHAIRNHWNIENQLHWVLDMGFREDESRARKDNAPTNFAVLRRIAFNLLKKDNNLKLGAKNKQIMAAIRDDYLEAVLLGTKLRTPF